MKDAAKALLVGAMFTCMLVTTSSASSDKTIPSALFVSKSENKNQVHYGVRVDERCAFTSPNPVFPYWKMLERGPDATEPLLSREESAYGIAHQHVNGDSVTVTLRALPARPITIRIARTDSGCVASAETTIDGQSARLFNVHVALGFLHVDHLVITGWASDGHVLRERVHP
ncbi:MAG TPA: DUF4833 domain-containing protein [Polyangiaceae bacterium]